MLAEASGCGAVLDVAAVPRPAGATAGDWLTCFPGFAMLTADEPGRPAPPAGPAVSAVCGELVAGAGVSAALARRGVTDAVAGAVHRTGDGSTKGSHDHCAWPPWRRRSAATWTRASRASSG